MCGEARLEELANGASSHSAALLLQLVRKALVANNSVGLLLCLPSAHDEEQGRIMRCAALCAVCRFRVLPRECRALPAACAAVPCGLTESRFAYEVVSYHSSCMIKAPRLLLEALLLIEVRLECQL